MNIFDSNDYRAFLNSYCEHESSGRGFRASLARAAGCQASYLSQVLKSRVHLTEDQLIGIAEFLQLGSKETEYLILLLRFDKAGTPKLRKYLNNAIEEARRSHLKLSHRVNADHLVSDQEHLGIYFSSWIPSAVHLLTSAPNFQSVDAIAERLGLPKKKVEETLTFLEKAGFVEKMGRAWSYRGGSIHVPKESPLQSAVQSTRRELAARSISLNLEESMHFSSIFTIDEADLEEVKKLATKLVEKSHKLISKSGTSKLACICLDLFEVV